MVKLPVALDFAAGIGTIEPMARVAVITNPVAGRGHGAKVRPLVLTELKRLFPDIELLESHSPGDATRLARASDAGLVIAVGGDGTIREVAAGLVGKTTTMAIVPAGSGNDFIKTLGIPADAIEACRLAAQGRARPVDAVQVTARSGSTESSFVYVNAAGFGFDARVVAEARKSSHLRGLPLYVAAVFRAVGEYRCPLVRITVNDRTWEQRVLLIAAANGRFYGGGMRIAPDAEPDDGMLDVCVADELGRFAIYRALPRLIKGTHISMKEVAMHRAAKLELDFSEPVMVQLDGDLLPGSSLNHFAIQILPAALRVITP